LLVINCHHYLSHLLPLMDLSLSEHSQVWRPWKHSPCILILKCGAFFKYGTFHSSSHLHQKWQIPWSIYLFFCSTITVHHLHCPNYASHKFITVVNYF
jgi:hypothetical protein